MKKIVVFYLFGFKMIIANAQSVTIDPRANNTPIVDIKSTTEGMVMPKMTLAQRNLMAGLTAGTQVYCTNCTPYGPYSYDGGSWVAMFQTTTVSPITYTVGQAAQGGIVFWIDPSSGGQHGLVAATADVYRTDYSNGGYLLQWMNLTSGWNCLGALAKGMYGGEANTHLILSKTNFPDYTAAGRAYGLTVGIYGDWYLPSIDELELLYNLRTIIGGFSNVDYWSSTESFSYSDDANYLNFSSGAKSIKNKGLTARVRAVRRF